VDFYAEQIGSRLEDVASFAKYIGGSSTREHSLRTAIDIDYRPVLWGLTGRGDGETRFVANDRVTEHLQGVLEHFDLVIGTEEEIGIAGGSTDILQALRAVREVTDATIVLKRGPFGATVFEGEIPPHLDDGITVKGVTVEVMNVLGAGDAFAAGFLSGWIKDEPHEVSLARANAAGALVVSRHGCTPAMPTREELEWYLQHADEIERPDTHPELQYLHRVTTRDVGTSLRHWPRDHVVKCLVFYSTEDDFVLRDTQEQRLLELWRAVCASGHELLLEIIPPDESLPTGESVLRSVERMYALGVRPDWWKLPCLDRLSAQAVSQSIDTHAPHCRGIVVLGLDAPVEELAIGFRAFRGLERVKGFAVGRTIFGAPARAWLAGDIDDASLIDQAADNFSRVISAWDDAMNLRDSA